MITPIPIRKPLSIILALADDGTIGHAGSIPWRLPEDMKRFKALTMDRTVIMGRKTWESLPAKVRPVPDRRNIVVSRSIDFHATGASVWHSLETALLWADFVAGKHPDGPLIVGGAELYREALPLATRILLTEVHASPGGDTRFDLDRSGFVETRRSGWYVNDEGLEYSFVTLERESVARARCESPAAAPRSTQGTTT